MVYVHWLPEVIEEPCLCKKLTLGSKQPIQLILQLLNKCCSRAIAKVFNLDSVLCHSTLYALLLKYAKI